MAVTSSQNNQYFSPKEMMAEAEKFALRKANKTSGMTLGLAIMAYGWSQWRSYQRLPLHEALQLGRLQGGRLSRTDLFLKLRLSAEKTDQLLDLLVQQGFLERVDEDLPPENEPVYRLLS